MAPRFRPPRPKGPVVALYDARRDKATDPLRLAYSITEEAARIVVLACRLGITPQRLSNAYVARHLSEKGLLTRQPGRHARYKPTIRGEAVAEQLRKRFPYMFDYEKEQSNEPPTDS